MLSRINSCVFPESSLKLSERDEPIHSFSKCSQAFLSTIANFSIFSSCKLKVKVPSEPNAPHEYSVSSIHPQRVLQKDEPNHSFMKCLNALLLFIAHSTLFKMFTSKPENREPLACQPVKEPVCHHPVSELSPPTFNAPSLPIISEESPRIINEESPPTINEPFLPTNLRSSLHLLERIILLEKEMEVVKVDSMRSAHFQKKLDLLFELDEGDPNHSIKNFYYMAVNRLTAFVTAIQSLSSGLVARNLSWKDNSVIYIISFLENSANVIGLAGTFAFGAGALVPVIALPILSGAGFLWQTYRNEQKKMSMIEQQVNLQGGFKPLISKINL